MIKIWYFTPNIVVDEAYRNFRNIPECQLVIVYNVIFRVRRKLHIRLYVRVFVWIWVPLARMRSNATSERKTISWMRRRKAVWYSTFFVQAVSFSTHWSHHSWSHKTAQMQCPFRLTIGYCIAEINRIRSLCRRIIKRQDSSRSGENGTILLGCVRGIPRWTFCSSLETINVILITAK